jgi:PAT family beta-lactamase induction signal transducer AmpG
MLTFADSRWIRFGGFALMYAAQGLPYGVFMIAVPTWLASRGHSSAEVGGFIATVSLPWTLKLISGPIMDRFSFLPMGRRRPWVLAAQTGILVGALLLVVTPADYFWLLAAGFFINACAAVQDVAVDGMAIDVLPDDERARANAFMFGGQSVGISGSSAGGAFLLAEFGVAAAGIGMLLSVGIIILVPLLFRERRGERLLPWSDGQALARSEALQQTEWAPIIVDLGRTLILPMSLLLLVIKFGDRVVVGLVSASFPVLTTQDLGLDQTFFPEWSAIAGICAAIFGVFAAVLIDRVGAVRSLTIGLFAKALVLGGAGLGVAMWSDPRVLISIIFLIGFIGQVLTIATIALFMMICAPKIAASQFAIYMAMSNLALSGGAALLGPVTAAFSFGELFMIAGAVEVLMVGLMLFFSLERHQSDLTRLFGKADPTPA